MDQKEMNLELFPGLITGNELKELIPQCMENYDEKNIHAYSYDLRNSRFQRSITSHSHELEHGKGYKLYSGKSAIVFSEETINLPLDVIVFLKLKDYGIPEGLSLIWPIRVLGHGYDRPICACVRNNDPTYFEISKGESIVQAFFLKLPVKSSDYDEELQNVDENIDCVIQLHKFIQLCKTTK